jgi:hypothetical protein
MKKEKVGVEVEVKEGKLKNGLRAKVIDTRKAEKEFKKELASLVKRERDSIPDGFFIQKF